MAPASDVRERSNRQSSLALCSEKRQHPAAVQPGRTSL